MQNDSGFKRLLTIGRIYDLFQILVGANQQTQWLAEHFWQCKPGEKIVDVGCGTASVLKYLPDDIKYVGYDISEEYIAQARQHFADRGEFLVGTAGGFLANFDSRMAMADLVLCTGLLHHLNDNEAIEVLKLTKKILSPSGRMVCLEPTFLVHQTWLSRWMVSRDRGQNVRSEQQWKELVGEVYGSFTTQIATGLNRIPYVHIIIVCKHSS